MVRLKFLIIPTIALVALSLAGCSVIAIPSNNGRYVISGRIGTNVTAHRITFSSSPTTQTITTTGYDSHDDPEFIKGFAAGAAAALTRP